MRNENLIKLLKEKSILWNINYSSIITFYFRYPFFSDTQRNKMNLQVVLRDPLLVAGWRSHLQLISLAASLVINPAPSKELTDNRCIYLKKQSEIEKIESRKTWWHVESAFIQNRRDSHPLGCYTRDIKPCDCIDMFKRNIKFVKISRIFLFIVQRFHILFFFLHFMSHVASRYRRTRLSTAFST